MLCRADGSLRVGLHDITDPQVLFGRHPHRRDVSVVRRVQRLEPRFVKGFVPPRQEAEAAARVLAAVGRRGDRVFGKPDAPERVAEAVASDDRTLAVRVDFDRRPGRRRRAVLHPPRQMIVQRALDVFRGDLAERRMVASVEGTRRPAKGRTAAAPAGAARRGGRWIRQHRLLVAQSELHKLGRVLDVEMRRAGHFPRAELVGVRLARRHLSEHIGLRQQLPDFDTEVGAHLPAAPVQHDCVVDGRERVDRVEIRREAPGRLRMAGGNHPLYPEIAHDARAGTSADGLPRGREDVDDNASPITVPPSVTSSDEVAGLSHRAHADVLRRHADPRAPALTRIGGVKPVHLVVEPETLPIHDGGLNSRGGRPRTHQARHVRMAGAGGYRHLVARDARLRAAPLMKNSSST